MEIFLEEAKKRKEQIAQTLSTWLQCKSVHDPSTVGEGAPFGKGVRDALDFILNEAKKDGFETVDDDGYACHIDYGKGDTLVGILGHVDVVPEGSDWTYPPFSGTIANNCIYGRGSQDDKGPVIASYFAMKIIKDLNLPTSKKVRMILGGDEERQWKCIEHYFKNYPKPDYGFTPDGDFPLVYGEKEIQMYEFLGEYPADAVVSMQAGTAANSVADHATAVVTIAKDAIQPAFRQFLTEHKLTGKLSEKDGMVQLDIDGVGAHASTPQEGVNAAVFMLQFLKANTENKMIAHFADAFASSDGAGLGVAFTGDKMGALTANLGMVKYQDGKYSFTVDTRYPMEIDKEKMAASIKEKGTNAEWKAELKDAGHKKGIFLDLESDLIKTLYKAYVDFTGDKETKPYVIGGGTFARAADNVVCFGMVLPGGDRLFHQKNEYVNIDDLVLGTAIYAQAIYDLIK